MPEFLQRMVRNPLYKLLSLGLALSAWLWVQGQEEHIERIAVGVDWVVPDALRAVERPPDQVFVSVRGTRKATRRAMAADAQFTVDLSSAEPGSHAVDLASMKPAGLDGLEVVDVSPDALVLVLDELASRRVPVRPAPLGRPAVGYMISGVDLRPPVVEVRGPARLVGALSEVQTQPLNVSGLTETATIDVAFDLPPSLEVRLNKPPRAKVAVVAELEERTVERVPVFVWQQPGWTVDVSEVSVTLSGPSAALGKLQVEDLAAFVHLPGDLRRNEYDAYFGPTEGTRVRIVHGAGGDVVVTVVSPGKIRASRL